MPEERELYRIAVKQPKATTYGIAGTCIVTNTRLILRWKNGKMEQYPFALIREVYSTKSTPTPF
jgi:hypothetical protein